MGKGADEKEMTRALAASQRGRRVSVDNLSAQLGKVRRNSFFGKDPLVKPPPTPEELYEFGLRQSRVGTPYFVDNDEDSAYLLKLKRSETFKHNPELTGNPDDIAMTNDDSVGKDEDSGSVRETSGGSREFTPKAKPSGFMRPKKMNEDTKNGGSTNDRSVRRRKEVSWSWSGKFAKFFFATNPQPQPDPKTQTQTPTLKSIIRRETTPTTTHCLAETFLKTFKNRSRYRRNCGRRRELWDSFRFTFKKSRSSRPIPRFGRFGMAFQFSSFCTPCTRPCTTKRSFPTRRWRRTVCRFF